MKMHVTGQPVLGKLRHALSAVIFGNPLFSPQEQLLPPSRIHEFEDNEQFARWLTNTPTVLVKRRQADSALTASSAGHVV